MHLKIKKEHLDDIYCFHGRQITMRFAPTEMYIHYYNGGLKHIFEVIDETPIITPIKKVKVEDNIDELGENKIPE
jgi:hypothetical protein